MNKHPFKYRLHLSIIMLIYILLAICGSIQAGAYFQQEHPFRSLLNPYFVALPIGIGLRIGSVLWWRIAILFSGMVFFMFLSLALVVWLAMTPPRVDFLGQPNVSEKVLQIESILLVACFGLQLLLLLGPVVRGRFKRH